jgi:hypothetical protein
VAGPSKRKQAGIGALAFVLIAAVVFGTAIGWYWWYSANRNPQVLGLSPEAKQYVSSGSLKLSDVQMKATESYLKQRVVEILGNIANSGDKSVDTVEIYCVFYDPYGQVVLKQRVSIVRERAGGLKPGETKPFRLPFDDIPESWNKQMPQLVIAGIKFST